MNRRLDPRGDIRRLNFIGLGAVMLLFGGVGSWAATAELAGAVIASGSVVVESNVKKVQHPTGGVVGKIFVHEGATVEEGDILIRLDDTVPRATLGVVQMQLDELLAREARLEAERDDAKEITFAETLVNRGDLPSVASAIAGERKLFQSRRAALLGQRSELEERIAQSEEEIKGYSAQQAAKEAEIGLISKELVGVTNLWNQNLVSISRLSTLQRDKARLEGERGQFIAEIAKARGKISETQLQIIRVDQEFRTDVLKELREAQGKIAELKERRTAAEDQLKRIDIRSPQSGTVLQLAVHTAGEVVSNAQTIMEIVPKADRLVIDAKVAPQDIDQLALGAKASVRIMAGDQRAAPVLFGELTRISADVTRDPSSQGAPAPPYYGVRVSLKRNDFHGASELQLLPGMQAEVFVETYARTPLQYLLKPLREQIARTFRER